ncbi:MAG: hypothetical protein ACREQ5_18420 [Candidatus Dormibacteria bacterium]
MPAASATTTKDSTMLRPNGRHLYQGDPPLAVRRAANRRRIALELGRLSSPENEHLTSRDSYRESSSSATGIRLIDGK